MIKAARVSWVICLALLSMALIAAVCSHKGGARFSSQAVCDKFGINSVAGAMGKKDVIVVVRPTSSPHSTSSSLGTHLRQVNVRVDRYVYGSGPAEVTVSQADMCGSSRDPDYVELEKSHQYVLFLTEQTPGIWGPYAVPIGFSVDKKGNLSSVKSSNPAYDNYDPHRWGIETTDDMAGKVAFYRAHTPTPAPRIPSPDEIFKPGLVLNFVQVFAIDKGLWFKAPGLSKQAGRLSDSETLRRLSQALNVPLVFESTTKLLPQGRDMIVVGFDLPKAVYGVANIGFTYSPADGVLSYPLAVPVQVTLPEGGRQIINQALGVQP